MQTTVEGSSASGRLTDFEQIFQAHQERVLRAAYRITGNLSDAEDVLQSVFLRLLRHGHDLQSVGDVGNYLYRAGVNAALDVVRSRSSLPNVPIDAQQLRATDDPAWDPATAHEATELREWLRGAVARLHPTAAEMFALRYFEGYDNPEIARLMNTSEGTVAVTLHRTRTRLQGEIRSAFGGKR